MKIPRKAKNMAIFLFIYRIELWKILQKIVSYPFPIASEMKNSLQNKYLHLCCAMSFVRIWI